MKRAADRRPKALMPAHRRRTMIMNCPTHRMRMPGVIGAGRHCAASLRDLPILENGRVDRVGIPGPTGLEMLRHAGQAFRDPLSFLAGAARRYGDIVAFPVPGQAALLLSDPIAARRVLQGNHGNYSKQTIQYRTLALVTGEGLLVSDGDFWMAHRRLIQPAFHRRSLDRIADVSVAAAQRTVAQWDGLPAGALVDLDAAMMRTALDVVGRALFGTAFGDRRSTGLIRAVLRALDVVVSRARNPLAPPPRLPSPGNIRLGRALRTIDAAVAELLSGTPGEPTATGPLLPSLRAAGLSEQEVRDEIVTLLIAGHETVASALTWTWHLLRRNAGAAERLHDEVDAVLAGRSATAADLVRLRWTRQLIEETLRLFPPAWVITRRARAADEVAGHRVAAGTMVIVSPFVVHRHPAWWAAPEQFRPERFAAESRPPREAYLPFGAGPRRCIGMDFALVESTLVLATIAQRFAFLPVGRGVRPDAKVTIRPRGGLSMRLIPRGRGAA